MTVFFRIGAHARGVLSFDLPVEPSSRAQAEGSLPFESLSAVSLSNRQVEREALDRWYGVNKNPDVHHKPSLMLAEQ